MSRKFYGTKLQVLTKMQSIVNRTMKAFKTDFYYDVATIMNCNSDNKDHCFVWAVLESGTHLYHFEQKPLLDEMALGQHKLYKIFIESYNFNCSIELIENTFEK